MRHWLRQVLGMVADFGAVIGFAVLLWTAFGAQLQPLLAQIPVSNLLLAVFGAVLIALDIVVRVRYPGQTQAPFETPSLPQPPPAAALPRPAPSVPQPSPSPEERIFVDRTPDELCALFQNVTRVQGEGRVAPYIGKWLRISGRVGNVSRISDDFVLATFAGRTIFTYNIVNMRFRDKQWIDRMVLKNPGDEITAIGRITSVDVQNVDLDDCELEMRVSSRGWEGVE